MSVTPEAIQAPFRFAQLSDPHLSDLSSVRWRQLASKRLLGYLSWRRRRRHEHRIEILDALRADLRAVAPDHTVVTGDLIHIALPSEFRQAHDWLRSMGTPDRVTVIPGNHDCYVATPWAETLGLWTEYMSSDNACANANPETLFPSLRVRGPVAFIGLSSAVPSLPLLAIGRLGCAQLDRLRTVLDSLRNSGLLRILLLHHPPVPGEEKWRKRLVDATELGALLREHRGDMVLHGHRHRALQSVLHIPGCEVPVFGIPSASAAGKISNYPSEYNLYEVRAGENSWNVQVTARRHDAQSSRFRERPIACFDVLRHAAH